jgi:hypothetical protein
MDEMAPAKFTIKELERRLRAEFPEMFHTRSGYALEELWHGGCRVRKHFHPRSLRLAVAEIGMRSDGEEELVAHATGTYAIPAVK